MRIQIPPNIDSIIIPNEKNTFSDALKQNYLLGKYFLEVEIEDLAGFDEMLSDKLHKQPTENLQIFEEAAREVADEITSPRPEGEEEIQDIQILLQSNANPTNIRDLKVFLSGDLDVI